MNELDSYTIIAGYPIKFKVYSKKSMYDMVNYIESNEEILNKIKEEICKNLNIRAIVDIDEDSPILIDER